MDVAMYDAILALSEEVTYQYSMRGRVMRPSGNNHQTLVPYGIFPTQDGAVAIAAKTDHHWQILCGLTGILNWPPTSAPASTGRDSKMPCWCAPQSPEWTGARPTREVVAALTGKVPMGPVNNGKDIFRDPTAGRAGCWSRRRCRATTRR